MSQLMARASISLGQSFGPHSFIRYSIAHRLAFVFVPFFSSFVGLVSWEVWLLGLLVPLLVDFPLASVSCALSFTYCFISSDHRLLTKRLAAHYSSYPVCFSSSSWIGWTSVIRADNVSCFNASHWGDFMLSRIILQCLSRQFKQTNDKNQ